MCLPPAACVRRCPQLCGTPTRRVRGRPPCRSRVYDALENFPRAVKWYRAALRADPFNYEASAGAAWPRSLLVAQLALASTALLPCAWLLAWEVRLGGSARLPACHSAACRRCLGTRSSPDAWCTRGPPPAVFQAFQALVGSHKLSNAEELELVGSLDIPTQQVGPGAAGGAVWLAAAVFFTHFQGSARSR